MLEYKTLKMNRTILGMGSPKIQKTANFQFFCPCSVILSGISVFITANFCVKEVFIRAVGMVALEKREEKTMLTVGIDAIEIYRIMAIIEKHPSFLKRVLGGKEYLQLEERKFKSESVAANFCAKEALLKAVGVGISGINLREVQLLRNSRGAPFISVSKQVLNKLGFCGMSFSVSITHTQKYASAVVVCYSKDYLSR